MQQIVYRALVTHLVLMIALAMHTVSGQTPSGTANCEMLPSAPTEREIGAGKTVCHRVDLPKNHYFRVRVEQKSIDVALVLTDPTGKTIAEVDGPYGTKGLETLNAIAPETGTYTLEIKAADAKETTGKYVITGEVPRSATENDRRLVEGQSIFNQAEKAQVSSPQEALDLYEKALTLFRIIPDHFEEGKTLIYIGAIYFTASENLTAAKYFEDSIKLLNDTQPLEKADALVGAAKSQFRLGQLEKALQNFSEALRLFKIVSSPQVEAQTLSNIGIVYLESAQKHKALKYFKLALTIAQNNGFREDEAAYYNNIGRALDDLGEIEKAKENFALALSKTDDKRAQASIKLSIAKTYFDSGDTEKALAEFEKAREMFKDAPDRFGEIAAINAVGMVHSKLGDKRIALENYNLALRLYRNFGFKRGEAVTFNNLMSVWQFLGNRPLAIFFGKQSVNAYQQLRSSAKAIDDESQRSFTANVESAYRTLAALLLDEERVSEALEVIGLLKQEENSRFTRPSQNLSSTEILQIGFNREESEAARDYKQLEGRFTSLSQQSLPLRREKTALEQRGQALSKEKKAELDKLQSESGNLNREFNDFLQNLSSRFPSKTENKATLSNSLTEKWQKRLAQSGEGAVLLTTLLADGGYYIIVTTADSQKVVRSDKIRRAELYDEIDLLLRNLRDPRIPGAFKPHARRLYQLLVSPVDADLEALQAKTLLLSLDRELRYVPFAALYDGQKFLVEKYSSTIVTLAQPADGGRDTPEIWRVLGAGTSKKIGEHDPLPQVPGELALLVSDAAIRGGKKRGLFPGKKLLDRQFSRSGFISALRKKPQLVHLATHFKLGSGRDLNSYLLFGDGDKLSLRELQNNENGDFELSGVDLLTLSACETGLPESNDANGVEIENLGVIVQRRGARSVMASLWHVADDSTPELMEGFYRRYKEGKGAVSKSEALRQAQIKMLNTNKTSRNSRYSHPAYWGAFVLLGNS